jgi:hypothetical protein
MVWGGGGGSHFDLIESDWVLRLLNIILVHIMSNRLIRRISIQYDGEVCNLFFMYCVMHWDTLGHGFVLSYAMGLTLVPSAWRASDAYQ